MKKLLAIVGLVSAIAFTTHAQTTETSGKYQTIYSALDTNTNAVTSYIYFNAAGIGETVKSMQLTVTKVSGTVAGTVIIDAADDGGAWVSMGDTLTLANQAVNSTLFYSLTGPRSYRARFTSTGTQVSYLKATLFGKLD